MADSYGNGFHDDDGDDGDDYDDDGIEGMEDEDFELPDRVLPEVCHDGFRRGNQQTVDLPELTIIPGDIPRQLDMAMMGAADAEPDEIMWALDYNAHADGLPPLATIDIDHQDGKLRLIADGGLREIVSIRLDEGRPDPEDADAIPPGTKLFLARVMDAEDDEWLMQIKVPERRADELAASIQALSKHHGMVTMQPRLFQLNVAESRDFAAVDPRVVAGMVIAPDSENGGWALMIEQNGRGATQGFGFDTAAQAVDAMRHCLEKVNRPVEQLRINYVDPEDGGFSSKMLTAGQLRTTDPATIDLPNAEEFSVNLLIGNEGRQPKVVGGVVLNDDWKGFQRPTTAETVAKATAVTEAMVYPAGRSDPHPYDRVAYEAEVEEAPAPVPGKKR
jgi:hypothetical protein